MHAELQTPTKASSNATKELCLLKYYCSTTALSLEKYKCKVDWMLANNMISQKAHKNTTLFKFIFLRRNIVHFLDIVFLFSYHSLIPTSGIIITWNRNLQKLEHNLQDPSITSRNTCIPSRNQVTLIQRDRRGNARIWSDNLQLACVQPPTSSYNLWIACVQKLLLIGRDDLKRQNWPHLGHKPFFLGMKQISDPLQNSSGWEWFQEYLSFDWKEKLTTYNFQDDGHISSCPIVHV